MKARFWGVRGSIPSPGPSTVKYGGNTPCVELEIDGHPRLIFDAGSGIRTLGGQLVRDQNVSEIYLFLSHTHWDHIQGFPFFIPLYVPKFKINICGPSHYEKSLIEILNHQMDYSYFPVRVEQLAAKRNYRELRGEEEFHIGPIKVTTIRANHPVHCLAYRIDYNGKRFVYLTDNEPYANFLEDTDDAEGIDEVATVIQEQKQKLIDFISGADIFIADTQYTDAEFPTKIGWGHSSTSYTAELAVKSKCRKCVIFHHDPDRSDSGVEDLVRQTAESAKKIDASSIIEFTPACEGATIEF